MKISILGHKWAVLEKTLAEEPRFENCDGFCDWTTREIFVRRELCGTLKNMEGYVKKVKRHEIIHAFLFESGLAHSSLACDSWATNEEMVDWLAFKIADIFNACKDADAL